MKVWKLHLRLLPIVLMLLFIMVFSALFALKRLSQNDIIIHVDLQNDTSYIEGRKVYFANAETRQFLDSAVVKKAKPRFR